MTDADDGPVDIWTLSRRAPGDGSAGDAPAMRVIRLCGIEPLDRQIGAFPRRTVPDTLHRHLFAPQAPGAEDPAMGHDAPLRLFAVLDGSKLPDVEETLAASGLPHLCLFKGRAAEELGAAAPWLVELDEGADLLRRLFTRSGAPRDLWDVEAALFLRSRGELRMLHRHLRRFTQLPDRGRLVFFRFWQPDLMVDILSADRDQEVIARSFLAVGQPWQIHDVIGLDRDGEGAAIHLPAAPPEGPVPVPALDGRLGVLLSEAMRRRRIRDMARALRGDFATELAAVPLRDLRAHVGASIRRSRDLRFTRLPLIYMLAAWELFYGPLTQIRDPEGILVQTLTSTLGEEGRFRRVQARLQALDRQGLLPRGIASFEGDA